MGARGNSGVILSQIVRGVCEVWGARTTLSTADVQGGAAPRARTAPTAPSRSPSRAPCSRSSARWRRRPQGVPDALGLDKLMVDRRGGRQGRRREDDGAAAGPAEGRRRRRRRLRPAGAVPRPRRGHRRARATGASSHTAPVAPAAPARRPAHAAAPPPDALGALGVPLLHEPAHQRRGHRPGRASRPSGRPSATALSSSATPRLVKIHVHTNDPGVVLSEALRYGPSSEVEINDMHAQTKARDERLRSGAGAPRHRGRRRRRRRGQQASSSAQLGCQAIVDGGQSMNPSAAQLLEAVDGARRRRGRDAAQQRQRHPDRRAGRGHEQPAHRRGADDVASPAGLAAMVAFDPDGDAVGNARAMEDAIAGIQSAEVTRAVRDSELDGVERASRAGHRHRRRPSGGGRRRSRGAVVRRPRRSSPREGAEYVTVLTALNGSGVRVARDWRRSPRDICPTPRSISTRAGSRSTRS